MAEKLEKVWNITDHPDTEVKERPLVIFGKTVMPGSYVKVPASRLKNAHKLRRDVQGLMAHVGPQPPADYLQAKEPVQLTMPEGHTRGRFSPEHSAAPEAPPADAPEAVQNGFKELAPEQETMTLQASDVGSVESVLGGSAEETPTDEQPKGRNGGRRR